MTAHAFRELIKYKWHAKTRHGIHSPFVYDFIEQLLYAPPPLKGGLHGKYEQLLTKIAPYYNCKTTCSITDEINAESTTSTLCDLISVNISDADNWGEIFGDIFSSLHANSIAAIYDIHKTEKHTTAWQSLYKSDKVKLSIDLYGMGLLFFKKEFKEQQHFVLRY